MFYRFRRESQEMWDKVQSEGTSKNDSTDQVANQRYINILLALHNWHIFLKVIRISRKYPWKPKEKFLLPWPPHPAPALLLQTSSRGSWRRSWSDPSPRSGKPPRRKPRTWRTHSWRRMQTSMSSGRPKPAPECKQNLQALPEMSSSSRSTKITF